MIKDSVISFNIKYDDKLEFIKESQCFKVVEIEGNYFIADFQNKLFKIEPQNPGPMARDFLSNIKINYSKLVVNKKNQLMFVESNIVFQLRDINLMIFSEDNNFNDFIGNGLGGMNLLLVYLNVYDEKDDGFIIKSFKDDRYLKVVRTTDAVESATIKQEFYKIDGDFIHSPRNIENYQLNVFVGNIAITNKKNYLKTIDKIALSKMKLDSKSYLNYWDRYNQLELSNEFKRFKEEGIIKYKFSKLNDRNLKLFFDPKNFEKITKTARNYYYVGNNRIHKLLDAPDFEEYKKIEKELLEDHAMTLVEIDVKNRNNAENSIAIHFKDFEIIKCIPVNGGSLCMSLLGNEISYKRRATAKKRILDGKASMSQLYTWFTDNPRPGTKNEHRDIDYSLISKGIKLTVNQEEAVSIILNTPDIAIIQGPPGTGKTTVISEALRQLNGQDENRYESANNLLSGFRQETVNNLVEKTSVFGIPTLKISRNEDEDKYSIIKTVKDYANDLIDRLLEKYSDLSFEDNKYIQFYRNYTKYCLFDNTIDGSIEILNQIKCLDLFENDYSVHETIGKFLKELNSKTNNPTWQQAEFLNVLYAIPLNKAALSDNKDTLLMNLLLLEDDENIGNDVKQVEDLLNDFNDEKAKHLRKELILKYRPTPEILIKKNKKKEIIDYLNDLLAIAKTNRLKQFGGEKIAILDFIQSLSENPKLIQDTMLEYSKTLGATNQYTISKSMYDIKSSGNEFDYVCIDEAATSSPLDLFIPMSVAKKKIILVGDHKQLPNIVDGEIIDQINDDLKLNPDENSQEGTLFEVLMDKAKQLEEIDGVKRVITLNTQFRMHPALGKIVSENFYDGIIKSARPEGEFDHDYHENKNYLHWIDVPYDSEANKKHEYREKNHSSRRNLPEARIIAKHIAEARKTNPNISIGVISIYSDQETAIKNQLLAEGIDDKNILVGTVDKFQGREFDIVYFSLAYVSNGKSEPTFSRLCMEDGKSLQCVALSRQKKMLIMVGDMKLYGSDVAQKKIPAIYNICNLCEERGWNE